MKNLFEYILNNLKEKAIIKKDSDALNKLNNEDLLNNLNELINLSDRLDYDLFKHLNEKTINDNLYSKIAKALANDYLTIYYINIKNDDFVEFVSSSNYQSLNIEKAGEDFFNVSIKNAKKVVHKEDLDLLLKNFNKNKIIAEINKNNAYNLQYRLVINDKTIYVMLKAIYMPDDNDHILIAVSNIDNYKKMELNYTKAMSEILSNSSLSLSSNDYLSIYNVDIETGEYIEYSSSKEYQTFKLSKSGKDFFNDAYKNAKKFIHKEDIELVRKKLEKETVIANVKKGTYSFYYRLLINNQPIHVLLKAVLLPSDEKHIIIGISNVDKEVKLQNEYKSILEKEKLLARRDGMTGALNKYSFLEKENRINEMISSGHKYEFGVVLLDINGLKYVNDTFGHIKGDEYIKSAYNLLNEYFENCSIFRTGGDEFVVIIENEQYKKADELVDKFAHKNYKNIEKNEVNLAFGFTKYNEYYDLYLSDVLDRADKIMYDNKTMIKNNLIKK